MAQLFSLLQVSPGSPISLVMTQLGSTVSAGEYNPCVSATLSLLQPMTSHIQVHPGAALSSLFSMEGAVDLPVFQESCSRPGRYQAWGYISPGPMLVPGTLPS